MELELKPRDGRQIALHGVSNHSEYAKIPFISAKCAITTFALHFKAIKTPAVITIVMCWSVRCQRNYSQGCMHDQQMTWMFNTTPTLPTTQHITQHSTLYTTYFTVTTHYTFTNKIPLIVIIKTSALLEINLLADNLRGIGCRSCYCCGGL